MQTMLDLGYNLQEHHVGWNLYLELCGYDLRTPAQPRPEAQTGVGAVAACQLFLDRVEALRSGADPARAACREQDQQAVALLEQRKLISESIVSQLRGLGL